MACRSVLCLTRALVIVCLIVLLAPTHPASSQPLEVPSAAQTGVTVDFRQFVRNQQLRDAIINALRTKPSHLLVGTQFVITSERQYMRWRLVSIASMNAPDSSLEYVGAGESGGLIAAVRGGDGTWNLGIAGTTRFSSILATVPKSFVSPDSRLYLDPRAAPLAAANTVDYKYPWSQGDWSYWQGWHGGTPAVDLGTSGADKRVLASAGGVVTSMCRSTYSVNVKLRDASGTILQYVHIDKNQLGPGIAEGVSVGQGRVLGVLRSGTFSDGCGYTQQLAGSAHVHWVIPSNRPFTVDGWTITYPDNAWRRGSETRLPRVNLHSTNTVSNPPVTSAPVHSIAANRQLGGSTVPVRITWSGSGTGSGISKYQVQRRKYGSAAWGAWGWVTSGTTAKTVTRQLASGRHQFQVRAVDRVGNWSAWKAGATFTVAAYQETSTAADGKVAYTGSWNRQSLTSAYGGYTKSATLKGSYATFSFTGGKQVAWVASKADDRGYADVYLDGVKVTAPNLYLASEKARQMVFARTGLNPSVTHTLRVYVTGTKQAASNGTRVDVDAFVVVR